MTVLGDVALSKVRVKCGGNDDALQRAVMKGSGGVVNPTPANACRFQNMFRTRSSRRHYIMKNQSKKDYDYEQLLDDNT